MARGIVTICCIRLRWCDFCVYTMRLSCTLQIWVLSSKQRRRQFKRTTQMFKLWLKPQPNGQTLFGKHFKLCLSSMVARLATTTSIAYITSTFCPSGGGGGGCVDIFWNSPLCTMINFSLRHNVLCFSLL